MRDDRAAPMTTDSVAGVALAAGAGTRLAPITDVIPKPLCPVATETLLDLALDRLASVDADPAVNVHHHADQIRVAVGGRAHVVTEQDRALGTAGALGNLRDWISGRPVLVVNADTWCAGSLHSLLDGWNGTSVRVLVPGGGPFGPSVPIVGTLLPWSVVRGLESVPTGLYEVVWRPADAAGALEVVEHHGPWADCGTPTRLLEANLAAMAGGSVVHPDAHVTGTVVRSAVSAGAVLRGSVTDSVIMGAASVGRDEVLHRAIRWPTPHGDRTVLV